jgi:surface protein
MKNISQYKKQIYAIVIVLILLLGLSFAWLTLTLKGTKTNSIVAGNLSLVLDDSTASGISLENAVPMSDTKGLTTTAYTFTITNNGNIASDYTIYLDDVALETGETRLDDSVIKYNLTKNSTLVATTLLSSSGTNPNRIINLGTIKAGTTDTYTLRVWIDSKATNDVMGKVFRGKLRVVANQKGMSEALAKGGTLKATTTYYDTTNSKWVYDTSNYYAYRNNITSITFDSKINVASNATASWDVSEAGDGSVMAYIVDDGLGTSTYALHIQSNGMTMAPTNCSNLFRGFTNLININNLYLLDTSQVTNMLDMFYDCRKLTSLDVSNFNTSQVTDMSGMFERCSSLTSLDVSNFNESQVTDMSYMFYWCSSLTSLDLSNFNTSQVTDMSYMFYWCSSLTSLDLSDFNTSQVTNMSYMFIDCSRLTSLDVSNFNTSQVTDMSDMFDGCSSLTNLDVSNFDTSKVTNIAYMFCDVNCTVDTSHFDLSKATDASDINACLPPSN